MNGVVLKGERQKGMAWQCVHLCMCICAFNRFFDWNIGRVSDDGSLSTDRRKKGEGESGDSGEKEARNGKVRKLKYAQTHRCEGGNTVEERMDK